MLSKHCTTILYVCMYVCVHVCMYCYVLYMQVVAKAQSPHLHCVDFVNVFYPPYHCPSTAYVL